MLDVQEMNDGPGLDDLGENGKPGRLSGEARLQSAASILATAVLRRKAKKAFVGNELDVFEDSSPVLGGGLSVRCRNHFRGCVCRELIIYEGYDLSDILTIFKSVVCYFDHCEPFPRFDRPPGRIRVYFCTLSTNFAHAVLKSSRKSLFFSSNFIPSVIFAAHAEG